MEDGTRGMAVITLCRILGKAEVISSMRVGVPAEVMREIVSTREIWAMEKWIENEFGFPWLMAGGEEWKVMTVEEFSNFILAP